MTLPTFEAFKASAKKALAKIDVPENELKLLDAKGPKYDLYRDAGVDSLDMLDFCFYVDHDLDIKLGLEKLIHSEKAMTLQNLYDSIRQDSKSPA